MARLTFAGRDQEVAAVADVAEVQVDNGAGVAATRQGYLAEIRGHHLVTEGHKKSCETWSSETAPE